MVIASRAALVGSLLGTLAFAGCSAIVPTSDTIRCQVAADGTDPCLAYRMRCVESECRPVCLESETCNRVDDDCDGMIDEAIDEDADGHLGCRVEAPDCDDRNPMIHPGIESEACNGIDDNCDAMVDVAIGGGSICPDGEACIPRRMGCVVPSCADVESPRCGEGLVCNTTTGLCEPGDDCTTSPVGCPMGQVCDAITQRCIAPGADGDPCSTDFECMSQRCYSPASLGLGQAAVPGGIGICGRACCGDTDCSTGFLCWSPGTGARSCVSRELLAMGSAGAPTRRACGDSSACSPDECVLGITSGYERTDIAGFTCGDGPTDSDDDLCYSNDSCRSGLCLRLFSGFFGERYGPCTGTCRTDRDCDGFEARFGEAFGDTVPLHCEHGRLVDQPDWMLLCLPDEDGERGLGSPCTSDAECQSGACIESTCRSTCCSDAECGAVERCRPVFASGHWAMHCAPAR
jgi:hypothetical protein